MKNERILVVDDELIIRKTLQQDLLDEGWQVDTAEDGNAALGMLENGYDLIITDLMMEGIGGLDVLAKAREINSEQAVFILTGFGELDSAVDALRLGAEDYLLKPYNHQELMLRVSRCLEKQELKKKVRFYENILSICCVCKKIRDDSGKEPGSGEWVPMEHYFALKHEVSLSHGYCPQCYQRELDELDKIMGKK